MSHITYENVGSELVVRIPEFMERFEKYKESQFGENLPHVLFADFTRFVTEHFKNFDKYEGSKNIFLKCVDFIEDVLLTGNEKLSNLIGASFIENLHDPKDYNGLIDSMKVYFKPKTLELVRNMLN